MKKIICLLLLMCLFCLPAKASDAKCEYLSRMIATKMRGQPFTVMVSYGEMLLNREESRYFPDTLPAITHQMGDSRAVRRINPTEQEYFAANIAYFRYGFAGDALYLAKWSKAENTALEMRSGARLYDWFFYR